VVPTLRIQLLGEFSLVSGDTPVTSIDVPRLQSSFAYLVLHHRAAQSRTKLAFLLWPDTTDSQAHSNLRTLVPRLRMALPGADVFLHTGRQGLQWQPDAPWTLGVLDFEDALAQAERARDSAAVRQALTKAVTLYRGDLLPGAFFYGLSASGTALDRVAVERRVRKAGGMRYTS
jgi:DNA-binding SARP family transcriptional activator